MKKIIIAVIVVAIAVGAGWYFFMRDSSVSADAKTGVVVATVNGEEILQARLGLLKQQIAASQGVDIISLDEVQGAQLNATSLDTLIGQVLIKQEVEKNGAPVSQEEVDTRLATLRAQFEDEAAFETELKNQNTTLAELATQIKNDLAIQAHLAMSLNLDDVSVSEEELVAEYQKAIVGVEAPPAFEDARAEVEAFVLQQKRQALLNVYVQELREKAEIEIL